MNQIEEDFNSIADIHTISNPKKYYEVSSIAKLLNIKNITNKEGEKTVNYVLLVEDETGLIEVVYTPKCDTELQELYEGKTYNFKLLVRNEPYGRKAVFIKKGNILETDLLDLEEKILETTRDMELSNMYKQGTFKLEKWHIKEDTGVLELQLKAENTQDVLFYLNLTPYNAFYKQDWTDVEEISLEYFYVRKKADSPFAQLDGISRFFELTII